MLVGLAGLGGAVSRPAQPAARPALSRQGGRLQDCLPPLGSAITFRNSDAKLNESSFYARIISISARAATRKLVQLIPGNYTSEYAMYELRNPGRRPSPILWELRQSS